jgi:hypothetical protein
MSKEEQSYLVGDDALKAYGAQLNENELETHVAAPRGRAIAQRTFVGHDTNISVKSDYNISDFEYFRPSQRMPVRKEEIIGMCMIAYKRVGLVKNIIDLMGDFGAQGIRLQHPNPSVQKFYNTWWAKINGAERSERFLNTLYRCGQTIIKKSYGSVSRYHEKKWKKGTAQDDVKLERLKTKSREIPLKYRFINPLAVEVVADDLAQFVGTPALGLKISPNLKTAVARALAKKDQMSPAVKKMIEKIPKDILAAIQRGDRVLSLDQDKINVFYYKKDDWEVWADPMCYCILEDLIMLNQLKLADRSALDGAISNIRLWKLGIIGDSPANSILPTRTTINKLRSILANNVGGGTMDLVWGPELEFQESNSQVYHWLGPEKYDVTITAIYEGMGVPASLRGKTQGSTNTGSFIGLNTLVKRLQYGRDQLTLFWNQELKYIHKAMGFPGAPPEIMFDFMALADEPAERQLLINLWDRDVISDDTILELFGRLPNVEKARVKSEAKLRTEERMPYKASPFHNPDKEFEYRKILLQGGGVAPSEIGVDLNDRKVDEPTRLEQMEQTQIKLKELDVKKAKETKPPGSAGRPKNVTETKKRKTKPSDKPSTRAFLDLFLWANTAQNEISHIITPSLLYAYGKKNVRSLSREEYEHVEKIKFGVLCQLEPFEEITQAKLGDIMQHLKIDPEMVGIVKTLKAQFVVTHSEEPKAEQMRQIYASAYALQFEDE